MQQSFYGGHPPSGSQASASQKLRSDAERIGSSTADRLQREADVELDARAACHLRHAVPPVHDLEHALDVPL